MAEAVARGVCVLSVNLIFVKPFMLEKVGLTIHFLYNKCLTISLELKYNL